MKNVGPIAVVVGVVVVIIGALLQIYGAAAVVFCSVIGGGILLAIAGAAIWLIRAFKPRTPGPMAA